MGRYDHIDFTPPAGVRSEAQKGLDWRSEYGRGGTAVGIARARDLSNGVKISPQTAKRMKAYFDRHQSDKQGKGWSPGEPGFPSNGRIAWALWGSDEGWAWSRKLVGQMEAADNERSRSRGGAAVKCERRMVTVEESETPNLFVESRTEVIEQNGEKREVAKTWIVGYAAKFNTNSLDLGDFVEQIDPRAFALVAERRGRRKSLETRALFNHDPNHVLGRYPDTLRLRVDEEGLRYEVLLPESRQDILELIQRGDIRGSSFSFTVAEDGEEWSVEEGRSVRRITKIAELYDVGPVTYPAYPDTHVEVAKRSFDAFVTEHTKQLVETRKRLARLGTAAADARSFLEKHGR